MPANETELLAGAQLEFHALFARFAETSFARAEAFDRLVHGGMEQLAHFPHSAPVHLGRYHRLRLGKLPYAIYYAIEGHRVFVHAILDTRLPQAEIARRLDI